MRIERGIERSHQKIEQDVVDAVFVPHSSEEFERLLNDSIIPSAKLRHSAMVRVLRLARTRLEDMQKLSDNEEKIELAKEAIPAIDRSIHRLELGRLGDTSSLNWLYKAEYSEEGGAKARRLSNEEIATLKNAVRIAFETPGDKSAKAEAGMKHFQGLPEVRLVSAAPSEALKVLFRQALLQDLRRLDEPEEEQPQRHQQKKSTSKGLMKQLKKLQASESAFSERSTGGEVEERKDIIDSTEPPKKAQKPERLMEQLGAIGQSHFDARPKKRRRLMDMLGDIDTAELEPFPHVMRKESKTVMTPSRKVDAFKIVSQEKELKPTPNEDFLERITDNESFPRTPRKESIYSKIKQWFS